MKIQRDFGIIEIFNLKISAIFSGCYIKEIIKLSL